MNTPKKHNSKESSPLEIPLTRVAAGLVVLFPHTKLESLANPNLGKYRSLTLDTLESEWLQDWLSERQLHAEEHTLRGYIQLTKEGGIIRAKCEATFSPLMECSRCGEEFREKIEVESSAIFVDKAKYEAHERPAEHSREIELTAEDLETYTYSGPTLCLDEFVLDTFETIIPTYPLCNENCKGVEGMSSEA